MFQLFDYHLHSTFSPDALSSMEEMAAASIRAGATSIAITDHFDPEYEDDDYPWGLDFPNYEKALAAIQEKYKDKLDIAKGIELGLIEDKGLKACEKAISSFPYDFVIASVHHTKRGPIHTARFQAGLTLKAVVSEYYEALYDCIKSYKNYDVLGHINVIDRYTKDSLGYPDEAFYLPYVEEILKLAIADGKGIEINTSAFRYGMADRGTPTPAILELYKELGGEILTIGSDAHLTHDACANLGDGLKAALDAGFTQICTYKNRKPIFHNIQKN